MQRVVAVVIVAAFSAGAGFAGGFLTRDPGEGRDPASRAAPLKTVSLPDVTGLTMEDALGVLARWGLDSDVAVRYQPADVPEGLVVGQIPAPGARVSAPAPVTLTVSALAIEPVEIPRPERWVTIWFEGVVEEADWPLAVIDVGGPQKRLVTVRRIAWGNYQGSGVRLPPPQGTRVCAMVPATPSILRRGIFPDGKVFVASHCGSTRIGAD